MQATSALVPNHYVEENTVEWLLAIAVVILASTAFLHALSKLGKRNRR